MLYVYLCKLILQRYVDILKLYQQSQLENLDISYEGKGSTPSLGLHREKDTWHGNDSDEGCLTTCYLTAQYVTGSTRRELLIVIEPSAWLSARCCYCLLKWPSVCPVQPSGPAAHKPFTHPDLALLLAVSLFWSSFLTPSLTCKEQSGIL